ncbi:MAG: hypothetical protein JXA06_07705 [Bacteroidetes bacterium]|nr:hypothetical protein [Bacteroidota bacterium]
MKSPKTSRIFMIIISAFYLVLFVVILMNQPAYDFYFFLQLVIGIVFFILAWRAYLTDQRKNSDKL